ncbi:MAG TPA: peptidoglycan-binding protein [Rhizomicrobium sp.]|jgi:Ca-activated chloride channel family protein|nr:peptidoglycan-binding protein [Rhizomicrobium sp.]
MTNHAQSGGARRIFTRMNGRKARIGVFFFALAVGSMALGFVAAGAAPARGPALTSTLAVERPLITRGWTKPVYVLLKFTAPDLGEAPSARPPLNLSLVLDRSGSMEDKGKIEYLRQAAKMAVDSLNTSDVISIVEFDDRITLMWPAAHAGDKGTINAAIDGLTPRGSTNLAGGLERGVAEDKNAQDSLHLSNEALNRVILLSDGLANTGVTDHAEIARMASQARQDGVRISTMGLGVEYDEDLMQAIAESGGGKYYYIESPQQLTRVFQEELKTAFTTRARNVHLGFHGSRAVKSAEIVGFTSAGGRDVSTDWPDFYAGETRTVLLRLNVDAGAVGPLDLGHFDVAWRDAQSGASATLSEPVRVVVTEDEAASDRSLNKDVAVESALVESERGLARNVKLYQAGQTDQARAGNNAIVQQLQAQNAQLHDERINRKIEALNAEQSEMTAAASPAAAPDARSAYLKSSKLRLYQAQSGQRSGYVLQPGDKGLAVENLQKALAKAGFYKGPVNGTYDAATTAAVKAYQAKNGVPVDGVAGAATQQKLGLY